MLTGAGASVELGRDEHRPLPLMGDWAERLRAKLGKRLTLMTGLAKADDAVKFEETLGSLFRWIDSLDATERFKGMVMVEGQPDDPLPKSFACALASARVNAEEFQKRLHTSLFEEFGPGRVDSQRSYEAYRQLFAAIGFGTPVPPALVCATTNYDRSLEIALEALGSSPITGFKSHTWMTPVLNPRGLGTYGERPSVLYLHGAVGWYRGEDGSIQGMPADRGYNPTLGSPAVLYPSPDQDPEYSEPAHLWNEFETAVRDATHILVLGHALNDANLVRELRQATARIGVTCLATRGRSRGRNQGHQSEARRITNLLPCATVISTCFGPEFSIDGNAVEAWRC